MSLRSSLADVRLSRALVSLHLARIPDWTLPSPLGPQFFTWEGLVPFFTPLQRHDPVVQLRPCCRFLLGCILVILIRRQLVHSIILGGDISRSRIPIIPILPLLPFVIFSAAASSIVG